jgi:pyruvate dehydrogenase E2 component (dihydrolipoamide acetyltransferase)
MPTDIRMPKLSDNMVEGVIIRWIKAPGDRVSKGEPLAEVETDKADVELEASDSGVLREITVPEGQSAAVGSVIAVLAPEAGDDGERAEVSLPTEADRTDRRDRAAAEEHEREAPPPAPTVRTAPATTRRPTADRAASPTAERPARVSPLARRLADHAGIDVGGLRGSGPGGRIVKRDVEASVRGPAPAPNEAPSRPAGEPPAPGRPSSAPAPEGHPDRVVEASRMRAAIARRMSEAKRDIPHFYVTAEIDMTETMRLRTAIKRADAMPGITVTHLLLRALAIALTRQRQVNASWRDGAIVLHDDVNIGIAVAVDDGLVVPVLHRAQTLSLPEIVAQARALTDRARRGKFGGDELTGGTFSLSNVGMVDVEELVAVINPPQAAILAVGSVKERPIVRDGRLAVAHTMRATLSCDHRVLNGIEGGRFLEELKRILENPVTLLLE